MDETRGFDGFCGDYFFDYDTTVNTNSPQLSKCFQHTVLTWSPTAILLVLFPIQYILSSKSKALPLPWTALLICKLSVQICLVLVTLLNWTYCVYYYANESILFSADDFSAPLLLTVSMAMLLLIICMCRATGLITSGVLFISLVCFVVCGIPEFIEGINSVSSKSSENELWPVVCFCIYYCLLLVQLFLNCFADTPATYRSVGKTEKVCPEKTSSFINRLTFWWFTNMSITGWRRALTREDLWTLNEEDSSAELIEDWNQRWYPRVKNYFLKKESQLKSASIKTESESIKFVSSSEKSTVKQPSMPSLVWCLFLSFKHLLIPATLLKACADTLQFANPRLLSLMIAFVEDPKYVWQGYFFAVAMFVTSMLYTFLLHQYFHLMMRFGMNLKTVLVSSVFNKALTLSNAARKEKGAGETVNIMSTDVQRFQDATFYVNMFISCPYQIMFALYFLWEQLGPSVLAGVGVMVFLIPVNYFLSNFQRKYQVQQMKFKDDRIKLMNEILNGIKVLKLYAWEDSFEKQILQIRQKELSVLRKMNYIVAVSTFTWTCAPFLVSVVSFAVFVFTTGEDLNPQKAFVSLSLFNILRFPLTMLPVMVSYMVQASVSNKRLKAFLCAEELDPRSVDKSMTGESGILVDNGTFAWGKDSEKANLTNIAFNVKKGQLVAVVGQVGSGKSSLLSAVLGEMDRLNGYVGLNGSISYVPQQAWIQNMSLKENVIFGKPTDETIYKKVIDACALVADLDILPDGDSTEIGEKGINLSGGQKQRVSLARAVYQNCDIYLLDDPLSAVDSHVGRHIFDKVISNNGMLNGKTRVLVTHGLSYLKTVDNIFVMTDGQITESGTYKDLLQRRGAFADILMTYLKEKAEEDEVSEDDFDSSELEEVLHDLEQIDPSCRERLQSELSLEGSTKSPSPSRKLSRFLSREKSESPHKDPKIKEAAIGADKNSHTKKIIQIESAETGRVKPVVYKAYIVAMGYWAFAGCVILTAVSNVFSVSANLWLSYWSNLGSTSNATEKSNEFYLGVYASLGISQGIFVFIAALLMSFATVKASKMLHINLLKNLFRSPLSFFDVTPLGRILNRCGKDVDVVDNTLSQTVRSWIGCLCNVVATLIVIVIALWYFAIVVLPLSIMYYFALRFYVSTSRQLKRLESVSRSPIFSNFQETLSGVSSIRAYGVQQRFIKDSEKRVDENQACYYPNIVSNRWIAVRLEFLGNLMVFFSALFAVLGRNTFNSGDVGLAISYSLSVTQVLNWAVRMTSDLETNIVAVERIKEYSETPTEAQRITNTRPPGGWPSSGSFVFDKYSLRYRENLELVLKQISCKIFGGEKIGIVGRTGAGKSSLTLALFRIVEGAGGRILIDDIDISTLGLHDLRSQLTIIPQDPVLFSGTLRLNLDPFDKHNDEEIWTALEQSHLKNFVSNQTEKLYHVVSEGGENLSVGQRQLVCLARALLRRTKVLVLDEATAAVDLETDDLIQKTIRSYFSDCTIITIAHRLNTILDSTRVMVLSAGNIVEFDNPEVLLKDQNSLFYAMAKDAGIV